MYLVLRCECELHYLTVTRFHRIDEALSACGTVNIVESRVRDRTHQSTNLEMRARPELEIKVSQRVGVWPFPA